MLQMRGSGWKDYVKRSIRLNQFYYLSKLHQLLPHKIHLLCAGLKQKTAFEQFTGLSKRAGIKFIFFCFLNAKWTACALLKENAIVLSL